MSPGVIADLEPHRMKFCNLMPAHVVFWHFCHPPMADEKGGAEPQLFEQRADKRALGFDCIIEGQNDKFFWPGLYRRELAGNLE
jgi:hypothetical protein